MHDTIDIDRLRYAASQLRRVSELLEDVDVNVIDIRKDLAALYNVQRNLTRYMTTPNGLHEGLGAPAKPMAGIPSKNSTSPLLDRLSKKLDLDNNEDQANDDKPLGAPPIQSNYDANKIRTPQDFDKQVDDSAKSLDTKKKGLLDLKGIIGRLDQI